MFGSESVSFATCDGGQAYVNRLEGAGYGRAFRSRFFFNLFRYFFVFLIMWQAFIFIYLFFLLADICGVDKTCM